MLRRIILKIFIRFFNWLPDKQYLKIRFNLQMGYKLNLENPSTFQEKLQWLKLYDYKKEYTTLVDKKAVKKYVAGIIGDNYIIPTLGEWDNFESINFSQLPEKFVLKTTHGGGGGGVVICTDKTNFDYDKSKRILNESLENSIYQRCKEKPYKNVPRKIIAEKYINSSSGDLYDYKFFCFDGKPKFFKIDFSRFIDHHANYYNLNWNLLPFGESDLKTDPLFNPIKPENFSEMVEIAKKLSEGFKFIRVDLYNVNGKIYFGELTFYPASGFGPFSSHEWDIKIGNMLNLQ